MMRNRIGLVGVLALLLIIYWPTFQTIPNGSSHLMMIDVGETQIVLNTWGTLHATGYPHYVILGNLLVTLFKFIGFSPAIAPTLVSLLWGMLALCLLYWLVLHLTSRTILAMLLVLIFGLTRFVWVHNVIAEIYSFALLLILLLYGLALWQKPFSYRITLLAFIGGLGAAHHRGIGLLAPALIYAVWPYLWPELRRQPLKILIWLIAGFVGFLPYIYLPLRAHATWAYGELDTWSGFWDQFSGKEAGYLFGWPESYTKLQANFNRVNTLIKEEISIIGVTLGIFGLLLALQSSKYRRTSITLIAGATISYGFSVVLYYDILATLILLITLSLAMGWAFLAAFVRESHQNFLVLGLVSVLCCVWLFSKNTNWIRELTHEETGLETIAVAENTPEGATLMLAWGPRYFAVGFAQDVQHRLQHFKRVDHRGDFAALVQNDLLVTPEYTFYNQSIEWWETQLGQRAYLHAVAPYLVQIDTNPELFSQDTDLPISTESDISIVPLEYAIRCFGKFTALTVKWLALDKPPRHLSVMVHLLDQNGSQLEEADQQAPVYGWRPVTTWESHEVVRDVYPLPRVDRAVQVRFGLYEQLANESFQNYHVTFVPLKYCK